MEWGSGIPAFPPRRLEAVWRLEEASPWVTLRCAGAVPRPPISDEERFESTPPELPIKYRFAFFAIDPKLETPRVRKQIHHL
jgi:hypothetical protein